MFTHLYTRSFSNTFMLLNHNVLSRDLKSKWFSMSVAVILGSARWRRSTAIDVFLPPSGAAALNNATPENYLHFSGSPYFPCASILLYNTQISMLRQPGTQIKYVGYGPLEPVISTARWCLFRLTNVSIVRMKKGGKRFEVSFIVQEV